MMGGITVSAPRRHTPLYSLGRPTVFRLILDTRGARPNQSVVLFGVQQRVRDVGAVEAEFVHGTP